MTAVAEPRTARFAGLVVTAGADDFGILASRSGCLSVAERERAGAYSTREAATAFVARRVFMREVLAAELHVDPRTVEIYTAPGGKPMLAGAKQPLRFSQSATDDRTVIALSRDGDVGIDAEMLRGPLDPVGMARRWFTPSEASRVLNCRSESEAGEAFLRIWTAREAGAKLTGEGMAAAIGRYELLADPTRLAALTDGLEICIESSVDAGTVMSIAWIM